MSIGTIIHVVKVTGRLLCVDVVGAAKEGAIAVVSAVGGDAVNEVLGDTD